MNITNVTNNIKLLNIKKNSKDKNHKSKTNALNVSNTSKQKIFKDKKINDKNKSKNKISNLKIKIISVYDNYKTKNIIRNKFNKLNKDSLTMNTFNISDKFKFSKSKSHSKPNSKNKAYNKQKRKNKENNNSNNIYKIVISPINKEENSITQYFGNLNLENNGQKKNKNKELKDDYFDMKNNNSKNINTKISKNKTKKYNYNASFQQKKENKNIMESKTQLNKKRGINLVFSWNTNKIKSKTRLNNLINDLNKKIRNTSNSNISRNLNRSYQASIIKDKHNNKNQEDSITRFISSKKPKAIINQRKIFNNSIKIKKYNKIK